MTRWFQIVAGWLLLAVVVPPADGQIGIAATDRVVFYGDALVYPPGFGYMVESFIRVKYPKSQARFWHVAVPQPGYVKIEVANLRFDELVAPLKPTIVVLCWGLGDGERKRHNPAHVARMAGQFEELIDRCLALGAKVYVLTPPVPTVSKKNILALMRYDQTIKKIAEALAAVGKKKGVEVLDWFSTLEDLRSRRPEADWTGSDGLAPSPLSQSVAANLIMEAWKLEPIEVAVTIDWTAGTVSSTHGSVDLTKISDDAMRLALHNFPMPFHTGGRRAGLREDFACSAFCHIMLKIDHLPEGRVSLRESGSRRKPTSIPAKALRAGYNLAIEGPLTTTGAVTKLAELIENKNRAFGAVIMFRQQLTEKPPEPEYLESYKTHLLSREQYHQASVRIIQRTPRTIDMSMDIRLATGD